MPFSVGPVDREQSPGWVLHQMSPMSIPGIPTGAGGSPGSQPLWHTGGTGLGSWGTLGSSAGSPLTRHLVWQKLSCSMQAEEGTDWLLELLTELQLQQYFLRIRDELNVTRLSHFEYVKNEDLEKIGMGRPGAYILLPQPPPAPLCGCHAAFAESGGTRGPKGWRVALLKRDPVSLTVPVSHRPAAAVGGGEAEESHVQAEILDEQGMANMPQPYAALGSLLSWDRHSGNSFPSCDLPLFPRNSFRAN